MNNYYDKYGRLHHKPCIDGEPSSNNGWIYTAYHFKLHNTYPFLQYDYELIEVGEECAARLKRHPAPIENKVPISRDEILGLTYLGFLKESHLDGWNFSPFPLPKFNLFKLTAQLWELSPEINATHDFNTGKNGSELKFKHRNYFWQNNLDQLYRFAFSVPIQDRAFILECWGETRSLRYYFYKAIAFVDSKIGKDSGIRWLKYGKSLAAMQEEFPEDHPLRNKA